MKTEWSDCQRARIHRVKVWKKCRWTVYPRKCLSQLRPVQAAAWHRGMLWRERLASCTEVFKRKGVIKHKASMPKFCSGITDLILKYHPREGWLGSGVVYIKASLVKSEGGRERTSCCSILQPHRSPQGCAGRRDAWGYVLLKAHAQTPPGAFWLLQLFLGLCRQLGSI